MSIKSTDDPGKAAGRLARVAFLGDLNGAPGRRILQARLETLRSEHQPDLIVANAENLRNGSGLSPDLYKAIRDQGIDAVTLGDHVYRDRKIVPFLEDPPSRSAVRRISRDPPPASDGAAWPYRPRRAGSSSSSASSDA